jgi:cellulose biosynthesis protein BcsQ/tetratricopeptide (TPR) repeat protein
LADEVGNQVNALPEPPHAKIVSVVSPARGAGRTSVVVNVGWILASAGKRVLVVDLDGEPPAATEYLRTFHVEDLAVGDLIGDAAGEFGWLVTEGFGLIGQTRRSGEDAALLVGRHRLPLGRVGLDMVCIPMREADQAALISAVGQQLRATLVGLNYDYVLVDYPTSQPEDQRRLVSRLVLISDVVVVCFRSASSETLPARQLATDIQAAAAGRPEVIAVPTQAIGQLRAGREQTQEQLHAAFVGLSLVQVPYRSYPYPRPLAVLLDDPTDSSGPLAAYEQLVARLTGHEVDKLAPISAAVRARCMRAVGLDDSSEAEPEQVTVCYAPGDRPWAEWLRAEFEQVGLVVTLVSGPPLPDLPASTVVVVQSDRLAGSTAGEWYAAHADPAEAQLPYEVVVVRVGTERTAQAGVADGDVVVDLSGFSEKRARAELRSSVAMAASDRLVTVARWPGLGATTPQSNLLGSSQAFVGRVEELERLREGLLADPVLLLTGPAGAGKSKLVRGYVAQYGHEYDFVWWLAADDPVAIRTALSELGRELGAPDSGDPVTAAVAELARTHRPWLLLYHNATDPAAIADLMPTGGQGHIVVIAPPDPWAEVRHQWAEQRLGPLVRADAAALLRCYVAELTDSAAADILREIGTLPITLRRVGVYLAATIARYRRQGRPVAEAVALATAQFVHDYRGLTGGRADADPTASCLALLRVSVIDETPRGRLALRLAELCSFMPSDGISLRLLTSPGMLDQLVVAGGTDGALLAVDPLEMHQILHLATGYGLFAVDWGTGAAVRMHRLLQQLIRDAMGEQARADRQAQVLRGLAAYAPTGAETDSAERLRRSRELAPYLEPSGALGSRDRQVRRWLVQHLRSLYPDGDSTTWRPAVKLGEQLLASWASAPSEPPDGGELRLQLAVQVANLHRALGEYADARRLDEEVIRERQRGVAATELNHPRTLRAVRGLGGDLRGLGLFRQASGHDQATWRGFRDAYGPDHPDTLMAANNVAVSAHLVGSLETALARWSELAEQRQRLFGDDEPAVWNSVARVGLCLREMGRYEQARQQLRKAQWHLERLRPPDHLDWLRVRHDLSIAERLSGRHLEALNRQVDVVAELQAALGEEHPETQAARLALAADRLAVGDVAEALTLGRLVLDWHTETLGQGHPFTLACEVDVAAFEFAAGDVAAALERGTRAAEQLAVRPGDDTALGRTHPWTLAAQVNRAGYLAATAAGDEATLAEAERLAERTWVRSIDNLGTDHPHTQCALQTLAAIREGHTRHAPGDGPGLRTIHLEIPRV